jgi:hypothetical protein
VVTAVEIVDWQMLVERGRRAELPRVVRGEPSKGPRRATVTVQWLRRTAAVLMKITPPWGIVCRNLDVTIGNFPNYHGTASFSGGTVGIRAEPMWANMKAKFDIDGTRIHHPC